MTQELQVGDQAPDFELPRDGSGSVSLGELAGKHVVLYFYPKDDTPGCTKEAIAFSGQLNAFDALGAVILGVSPDTVAKHDKFKDKHGLRVTLLADEDAEVCKKYGVWKEKNMYGRKFWGVERSTFLIGPSGEILEIWRKVKVAGHDEAVLEALKSHL